LKSVASCYSSQSITFTTNALNIQLSRINLKLTAVRQSWLVVVRAADVSKQQNLTHTHTLHNNVVLTFSGLYKTKIPEFES